MTHAEQLDKFLAILDQHRGLARAISVAEMAAGLGFERDKSGQRRAQIIKASAVEQGHLVGSSCGLSHGWFKPSTQEEVNATVAQYEARIKSLARLILLTKGAAGFTEFMGQITMEFDKEYRSDGM